MKREIDHWKKAVSSKNQQRILKLLNEIGPMRFKDLYVEINKTSNISQPTLSKHLKQLEKDEKIERYWNKNKGGACYRIKPQNREKVKAQIQKYEAISFIEGISNPIYIFKESRDKRKAMAAFSSVPSTINRKKMEVAFKKTIRPLYLKLVRASLNENQKMAVVIMLRGKEGVSHK